MYTWIAKGGEYGSDTRRPDEGRQHRRPAAQLEDRHVCLSGRRARIHQLALGTECLARFGRALRPDPPHGRSHRRGPRRRGLPRPCGHQRFQEFRHRPRQAFRARDPRRPCDRRSHHLPPGAQQVPHRRPRADLELDHVPGRHRQVECEGQPRPALGFAARRQGDLPHPLPVPAPGPRRRQDLREDQRRPGAGGEVLPCVRDQRRLAPGEGAAPRNGRRTGTRALGPLCRQALHPDHDPAGRPRRRRRHASRGLAPIRPTRSNRAGSPRPCPGSTPATG